MAAPRTLPVCVTRGDNRLFYYFICRSFSPALGSRFCPFGAAQSRRQQRGFLSVPTQVAGTQLSLLCANVLSVLSLAVRQASRAADSVDGYSVFPAGR